MARQLQTKDKNVIVITNKDRKLINFLHYISVGACLICFGLAGAMALHHTGFI